MQPDRFNAVSYFKHCWSASQLTLSPQQLYKVRATFSGSGVRRALVRSN